MDMEEVVYRLQQMRAKRAHYHPHPSAVKSTDQPFSSVSPALSSPIGPLCGRVWLKPGSVSKVSPIPGVNMKRYGLGDECMETSMSYHLWSEQRWVVFVTLIE